MLDTAATFVLIICIFPGVVCDTSQPKLYVLPKMLMIRKVSAIQPPNSPHAFLSVSDLPPLPARIRLAIRELLGVHHRRYQ